MRLSDLGEKKLIESHLLELVSDEISRDNDVSYVRLRDGYLAVKIDGLSESTSRPKFVTYEDFGWRCVTAAVSDMFAKLVRPEAALISITAPDLELESFLDIVRGLRAALNLYGIALLGGDLNQGSECVIDVVMIGRADRPIPRAPERGSILVTKPEFGYTGLVLHLYYRGDLDSHVDVDVVRTGVERIRRPALNLEELDRLRRLSDCIVASMDSSDGLGDVLWTMSRLSGLLIEVYRLPAPQDVVSSCRELGVDPAQAVFSGGDEYVPVFAVRPECVDLFRDLGYVDFARALDGEPAARYLGSPVPRGWEHFRRT